MLMEPLDMFMQAGVQETVQCAVELEQSTLISFDVRPANKGCAVHLCGFFDHRCPSSVLQAFRAHMLPAEFCKHLFLSAKTRNRMRLVAAGDKLRLGSK
jgi:hypothetical protein